MSRIITEKDIQQKQNKPTQSFLSQEIVRNHILPALFYLLCAVIFSWPLVLHLTDHVILTGSGDAWAHLWNSWWARFSLLTLHSGPFHTDMLFWPQGASLYFHALDPFTGYISIPFQLLFGLVPAFNLMVLFEITLAAYSASQLVRYLSGNLPAAIVAGLIYAFSPLESLYLNLGQLELMSIGWLPLFIMFFIKTLKREPRIKLNFSISILLLLVISLVTWYYLLYALLFAGFYTLYLLFEQRRLWRSQWLKVAGLAVGVVAIYLILISPVLLPTLHEANNGDTQARQSVFNVVYNSSDLKSLLWPEPSLLWGGFGVANPLDQFTYHDGAFLGLVALLLAAFGLVTSLKKSWFWAVLAIVFLILSLGPVLRTNYCYNLASTQDKQNHLILTCTDTQQSQVEQAITLPGKILYDLPFGSIARVPLRFELLVMLSLAVLAAEGIIKINSLVKPTNNLLRLASPIALGLLVFAEFLPLPRVLHDTSVSPFYTQVKNEGNWNDFALLETPDKVSAMAEYYQTVHNHPVLGGYLSRKQVYPYDDTPGWNELRYLNFRTQAADIISRDSLANTPLVMAYYHIKYVVLHQNYLNTREASIASEVLKETLGNAAPVYKDDELMAYRMPETVPQAGSASQLVIGLGEGWNAYQNGTRSLNGAAQLLIFNPSNSVLKVTLTTTVLAKTDHLQLTIHQSYGPTNNNKDATISNTSINLQPTKLSAELTLQPGLNTISFEPDANGKSILSFGVVQIK